MVSNLTSGVYKFQLTVTDTIGQSDSIKVTVLVLTPEQSEREYPDGGGKRSETSDRRKISHQFSFFSSVLILAIKMGLVSAFVDICIHSGE